MGGWYCFYRDCKFQQLDGAPSNILLIVSGVHRGVFWATPVFAALKMITKYNRVFLYLLDDSKVSKQMSSLHTINPYRHILNPFHYIKMRNLQLKGSKCSSMRFTLIKVQGSPKAVKQQKNLGIIICVICPGMTISCTFAEGHM